MKNYLREKKKSDHVSVGVTSLGLCIGKPTIQTDSFKFVLEIKNKYINNLYQLKLF